MIDVPVLIISLVIAVVLVQGGSWLIARAKRRRSDT